MNKVYVFFILVLSPLLLVSYSINPPDGKTGAPGDGFCIECHTQGSSTLDGTIAVEGFPETITPGEKYVLTVINHNTVGDAIRGGFQMTILGPFNTKAGNMTNPSASSAIAVAAGRQYFEHHPALEYPDSNVVQWTVEWTAPEMTGGSKITWYAAGNIANGNFQEVGDRIVFANGNGTIILAATEDLANQKPTLYPNPGYDQFQIKLADNERPDGEAIFYNLMGVRMGEAEMRQGNIKSPQLPTGIYLVEINHRNESYLVKWTKM